MGKSLTSFRHLKTSDKYKHVNSVPWCVLINCTQKRPPITHDTSLEIWETFDGMSPCV
jgi:hypothetical protein